MYGYSIVNEDAVNIARTNSGYLEAGMATSDTLMRNLDGRQQIARFSTCMSHGVETIGPKLERKSQPNTDRYVSCRSVNTEYDLGHIPTDNDDDDLAGSFSRFHAYYTSMKGKETHQDTSDSSNTLSEKTFGSGKVKKKSNKSLKKKYRDYDTPPSKRRPCGELKTSTGHHSKYRDYDTPPPKRKMQIVMKNDGSRKVNHQGECGNSRVTNTSRDLLTSVMEGFSSSNDGRNRIYDQESNTGGVIKINHSYSVDEDEHFSLL